MTFELFLKEEDQITQCIKWMSLLNTHLSISVIGFSELQMFPSLAAKVQPFALQPFHGGFSCQGGRVHPGYKTDIRSCHPQTINSYNIM